MEKGTTTNILDHGYVKLVDFMGTDESIIEAARMSTGTKGFVAWAPYKRCDACGLVEIDSQRDPTEMVDAEPCENHKMVPAPNGDAGLLEFMLKNGHTSPFEMCELVIEVQAPIMVYREWHRHRTQSYSELSARYTQMPNLHYVPSEERLKAIKSANKQEASKHEGVLDPDEALSLITKEQQDIYMTYDFLLERGVPKEVARINTPVSRYSRMRAKTDLLNWLKFLNLRMRPTAQWEIRQYANAVAKIIQELFPRTYFLFEEYWLYSRSFSRMEMHAFHKLFTTYADNPDWLLECAGLVGLPEKRLKEMLKKLTTPAEELL